MPAPQTYERFPMSIVVLSNALSLSIYREIGCPAQKLFDGAKQ